MEVAAEYEILVVNVISGISTPVYAYRTNDIVYEEGLCSGVCMFFDKDMEMTDVVASYDDILADSMLEIKAEHEYYCMMYDESNQFNEDEVDGIFYGVQNGELNMILMSDFTEIMITLSNN
jgi:hypothetical protein